MKVLDLFAGIGGFSLGLERAGMETVAFCEIEEYPRKVLALHWPDVPIFSDVREIYGHSNPNPARVEITRPHKTTAETCGTGKADKGRSRSNGRWVTGTCQDGRTKTVGPIDVITAGFPCQDISTAGKGAGIEGERSGLWSEIARLAGELRPRYIILENVSALLSRGLDKVLGDLAEIGYDAEWHCIPASHLGAPHRRDRWWCVCYPDNHGFPAAEITRGAGTGSYHSKTGSKSACEPTRPNQQQPSVAYPNDAGIRTPTSDIDINGTPGDKGRSGITQPEPSGQREDVADTKSERYRGRDREERGGEGRFIQQSEQTGGAVGREVEGCGSLYREDVADTYRQPLSDMGLLAHGLSAGLARSRWLPEPGIGRVTTGIPDRTARLKALGNSLIPQMPELIGRAIMAIEAEKLILG